MRYLTLLIFLCYSLFSFTQDDEYIKPVDADSVERQFDTRFFVEGRYGLGVNTGLWSSGGHRGVGLAIGSKWQMRSFGNIDLLITVPWISFLSRNASYGWGDIYPREFSVGGLGMSFFASYTKRSAIEFGLLVEPFFQEIMTSAKRSVTGGLKGGLDMRFYFKTLYLGIDAGAWMNVGYHYLLGVNSNVKIGFRF